MPEQIRLQKYLSMCGVASRRHSEILISNGQVSVNGYVVTKQGIKVDPLIDKVYVDGKLVTFKNYDITIALNKPAGYVSTMSDPQNRPCVADLIPKDKYPNLFPIGRLDRLTCGLLLFTTNGNFANHIMHPKCEIDKLYLVTIEGFLTSKQIKFIENGANMYSNARLCFVDTFDYSKFLKLENQFFVNSVVKSPFRPQDYIDKKFSTFKIVIHEGKNRQIRKMFAACGHDVLLLSRLSIGNIKLDDLEAGKWRKINYKNFKGKDI